MSESTPRHQARESALQAIYQWQLNETSVKQLKIQFVAEGFETPVDLDYFFELIQGVIDHIEDINKAMAPFLDREIKKINPVELAAIRVGICELLYHHEIPYKVVINEALDCTKTFGAEEGYRYVNGILDKVAQATRKNEIEE